MGGRGTVDVVNVGGVEPDNDASWIDEMYSQAETTPEFEDEDGFRTLYRPVGQKELDLIRDSDFPRFPPRLSFQPIFYPVLVEEYAHQIAREWNTKDEASGFVGYVTRFRLPLTFLERYEVQNVGGRIHCEYWVPAEELAVFNDAIEGGIEVIAEYRPAAG